MKKLYFTKKGFDYVRNFEFVGYGIDAQPIYAIKETKFNIAYGVIYMNKFVGYCDENGCEYNSVIR